MLTPLLSLSRTFPVGHSAWEMSSNSALLVVSVTEQFLPTDTASWLLRASLRQESAPFTAAPLPSAWLSCSSTPRSSSSFAGWSGFCFSSFFAGGASRESAYEYWFRVIPKRGINSAYSRKGDYLATANCWRYQKCWIARVLAAVSAGPKHECRA